MQWAKRKLRKIIVVASLVAVTVGIMVLLAVNAAPGYFLESASCTSTKDNADTIDRSNFTAGPAFEKTKATLSLHSNSLGSCRS